MSHATIAGLIDSGKRLFHSKPDEAVALSIKNARDWQYERQHYRDTIQSLSTLVESARALEELHIEEQNESESELEQMLAMAGRGPWRMPGAEQGAPPAPLRERLERLKESLDRAGKDIDAKEANSISAQGAFGDIELALQNIDWQREINLQWIEFSRWGIQQIILYSRLYYIKNPMIQRGINVAAFYVFGRGFDVSSDNAAADAVIQDFFERNKRVLGQNALVDLERRKYYDGNLFWVFFSDKTNKGKVSVRTIDATEIMDIVSDPDDSETPRFYKRVWSQRIFNATNASYETKSSTEWYPALGYEPTGADKLEKIGSDPVKWDSPVLHRKCGGVAKWTFGCPPVYAALDWAKSATRFLEHCATIKRALAQFSMLFTTKGGQAAIQGAKQQLSTTVGPNSSLLDQNPNAVAGSIFAAGPGTTLSAFKTNGAGGDPDEVRQFKLMVCMVFGLPESFWGDMNTSNLATATSLDRPTELGFLEKQEAWREDLTTIVQYVLKVSMAASSGVLRESLQKDKAVKLEEVEIRDWPRRLTSRGTYEYVEKKVAAGTPGNKKRIDVKVYFPTIIEADMPAMISAIVEAMTLGNSQGQVVGIDEKAGVRLLGQQVGLEDNDDLVEGQYPDWDPEREQDEETTPPVPPPAAPQLTSPPAPVPAPVPAQKGKQPPAQPVNGKKKPSKKVAEALRGVRESIDRILLP